MASTTQIWRGFARRQQKIEKAYVPKMAKAIQVEVNKVIAYLQANGPQGVQSHLHTIFISTGIQQVLTELYKTAALSEALIYYTTLRRNNKKAARPTIGFNKEWSKIVDIYLNDISKFKTVEQINATTKKRLLSIISQGIQDGDSVDIIIQKIKDDNIALMRAQLIVRTESVGAMNMGAMMGAISTGIKYDKAWITAGDHRVRGNKQSDEFSHVELDGQVVHIEDAYNNGESIRYPGDKSSSPSNFCNCRCCQRFIARRDAEGRIMRYPEPTLSSPSSSGNKPKPINAGEPIEHFTPGDPASGALLSLIAGTLFGDALAGLFNGGDN